MAGVNVSVAPEIINWVIEKIQFSTVNNSVFELLNKWKSGEKVPTFNQIEDVSKKTNIPFGYFFLEKPPVEECKIVEYRTIDSITVQNPSRNLIDTVDMMSNAQEWMIDYVKENGQEPLSFVGADQKEKDTMKIAAHIRSELHLSMDWFNGSKSASDSFRALRQRLEDAGIMVMMNGIVGTNTHRKLSLGEFRAFTLVDPYAPLIFINSCDTDNGKLFSLVHETAHIWIGTNSFYNTPYADSRSTNALEVLCNAVAGELLVPADLFLEKWEQTAGSALDRTESLAKYFHCSRYVIIRRALDNQKVTSLKYNEVVRILLKQYEEWKNTPAQKNPGGDYYRTLKSRLDHRFVHALEQSAKEGRTQYTEAYHLTNTNRKTFQKLVNEIGGAVW